MKYKLFTYYIVTKGNDDGTILTGDTLFLRREKRAEGSSLGEYTMFLPPRETQGDFFGMAPMNCVIYFDTKEELDAKMDGIEIEYDVKLAQEIIDDKQKEIDKIRERHELTNGLTEELLDLLEAQKNEYEWTIEEDLLSMDKSDYEQYDKILEALKKHGR